MKAKIIETGEIIEVNPNYYPTIYKEAKQRGREFYEEELELMIPPRLKMVRIDKAIEWLQTNVNNYIFNDNDGGKTKDWLKVRSDCFDDFRKAMEE